MEKIGQVLLDDTLYRAKIYIQMVQLKMRCWRLHAITVKKNGIR